MSEITKSIKDRREKFTTEIRRKHTETMLNNRRIRFMDKNKNFFGNNFIYTNDYTFDEKWVEEAKSFVGTFKDSSVANNACENLLGIIKKFRIWISQTTSYDSNLINLFKNPDSIKAFHNLLKNCLQEFSLINNIRELVYELTLVFVNLAGIQEQVSTNIYEQQVQTTMVDILKNIISGKVQHVESIGNIFMFLANLTQACQICKYLLEEQCIDKLCLETMEILKQFDMNPTILEAYGNIIYFISSFVSGMPHDDWSYYSNFLSVFLDVMKTDYGDIVTDAMFGVYSLLAIAKPKNLDCFYENEGTIERILQLTLSKNDELKQKALMLLTDFSNSDLTDQVSC